MTPETIFLAALLPIFDPEVHILIKQTDHKRFQYREVATNKLIKLEERAILHVKIAAIAHSSLETRKRCERVLDAYYTVLPTKYDRMPWIDSLPHAYPERTDIIQKYLERARENGPSNYGNPNYYEYPNYRIATYIYIRDLFEAGWSRKQVIDLLDRMVPGEKAYWKQYHNQHMPQILKAMKDD